MKKYAPEYLLLVYAAAAILALASVVSCNAFKGDPGPAGPQGPAGHSAIIKTVDSDPNCLNGGSLVLFGTDLNDDGILQATEVISSTDLCDGLDGAPATQPQFTPVIAITPCGPNSSSYKEVLLGLTGGGIFSEIITNASDDTTIRNTLLPDGSYYDTDSSRCDFTISAASNGDKTISWSGSTNNGSSTFSSGSAVYSASRLTWSASYGPIGD